jgi:hypothetical protein
LLGANVANNSTHAQNPFLSPKSLKALQPNCFAFLSA